MTYTAQHFLAQTQLLEKYVVLTTTITVAVATPILVHFILGLFKYFSKLIDPNLFMVIYHTQVLVQLESSELQYLDTVFSERQ